MSKQYRHYLGRARYGRAAQATPINDVRPKSTKAEIAIAFLTSALLLVAVVAAVATYLQWGAARDSLEFARESAEQASVDTRAALKISDRLAKAAENQARETEGYVASTRSFADTARLSLKDAQRSQVNLFLDNVNLAVGSNVMNLLHFNNTGSHSVYDIILVGAMKTVPRDDYIAIRTTLPVKREFLISSLSAGGSTSLPIESIGVVDQPALDTIKAEALRLYIFGEAYYRDGNGNHVVHVCAVFYGTHLPVGQACLTKPDT